MIPISQVSVNEVIRVRGRIAIVTFRFAVASDEAHTTVRYEDGTAETFEWGDEEDSDNPQVEVIGRGKLVTHYSIELVESHEKHE
jgi:hypothetical protein